MDDGLNAVQDEVDTREELLPIAPLVGVVAALVVGFVTAVVSLRVRGVSLAVVTLAGKP